MNMDMTSASPTGTAAMAMPTTTGASHMSMDMGGAGCKISMLWNWNTVDACFISSSWHITSRGMFAGSCIGVILLVISLEFLRRLGREYDRYIVGQFVGGGHENRSTMSSSSSSEGNNPNSNDAKVGFAHVVDERTTQKAKSFFRPNVYQQAIRAGLHMVQFGVAYFIMLLAMYYNGYLIICILIGAFIGSFIFSWEQVATSDDKDVTGCCG